MLYWKRHALVMPGAFMPAALGLLVALSLGHAQSRPAMTRETFDQWMTELSNWGRWGKQDEMGAINLITPAKRKQAAALVKDGVSVSMARNTIAEKAADNGSPFEHTMTATGSNPLEGAYSMDVIS